MKYASNNIRNILIAGHAGSGKTTLTEALVYFSGAAERMGRVEDGTTISDFDPEEAKRKASLSASVVPVEYEGIKYNLIDAPGLFDFEAGEYEGIRAAESVLVVRVRPQRRHRGCGKGVPAGPQEWQGHHGVRLQVRSGKRQLLQDP